MREKHPSVKKLHKLSHNGSPSEDVAQSNIFEPQRSRLWRSLNISGPTCLTGTDGVSEDYLGCALQICTSSSSPFTVERRPVRQNTVKQQDGRTIIQTWNSEYT